MISPGTETHATCIDAPFGRLSLGGLLPSRARLLFTGESTLRQITVELNDPCRRAARLSMAHATAF